MAMIIIELCLRGTFKPCALLSI